MGITTRTLTTLIVILFSFYSESAFTKEQLPTALNNNNKLPVGTLDLLLLQPKRWKKTIGGDYSDSGYFVQQTTDGGYIIAGTTDSFGAGGAKCYLVKITARGALQWSKTYGETAEDYGYSAQQTADGGYIITGSTRPAGEYSDVLLVKTAADGQLQWSKSFGGPHIDGGFSVQQTADNGYIIAGTTESFGAGDSDVYLVKTNESGVAQWSRSWGGPGMDRGRSVIQTSDGGYVITGSTNSAGPSGSMNIFLIHFDSNGFFNGEKFFGGSSDEYGNSVAQTSDSGYIIAGTTKSFGAGSSDIYLIKTNDKAIMQWSKTFGGSGSEIGTSVTKTQDDGYIISGATESYGAGGLDVYLIKVDSNGILLWGKAFGGAWNDGGTSVCQTADGGYIVAGEYGSGGGYLPDVYVIKTDSQGGAH